MRRNDARVRHGPLWSRGVFCVRDQGAPWDVRSW